MGNEKSRVFSLYFRFRSYLGSTSGRRAVSEPVAGVREAIAIVDKQTSQDANALRARVDRLLKRMESRAKQKDFLTRQGIDN